MPKDEPPIKNDRTQLISEGTRWLLEMEVLNIPHMKNTLVLNIYKVSDGILETELLIDENAKKMLIYLKLSSFAKMFKKREISQAVLDMLQEVLPSFQFRVTLDPIMFLKATRGIKEYVEAREAKIAEFRKALADKKKAQIEAARKSKKEPKAEEKNDVTHTSVHACPIHAEPIEGCSLCAPPMVAPLNEAKEASSK